jgi:D-methionine transport system substrate-binding protein
MHKIMHLFTPLLFVLTVLSACGAAQTPTASNNTSPASRNTTEPIVLRVGATPTPAGEVLAFIDEQLAPQAGLDLEVIEFTDYVQPNIALNDKQLDANFFQHVPYMEDFGRQHNIEMVPVVGVYIAPLGVYSQKVQSLAEVPDSAVVAIPNDTINRGRALQLLADNDLLTLREGVTTGATVRDVVENPKNLQIRELEAAQLPRSLPDTTLSIINVNFALEAGLDPSEDALARESAQNNPYANVLAVLKGRENDPNIQKLGQLLNSEDVRRFVEERFEGAVLPTF